MSTPLENERDALLTRMDASRNSYRARLVKRERHPMVDDGGVFPRSRTFRFIARHPYYASMGMVAALALIPRRPLGRAVKGGIALTAGILGSSARTLVMRQILPSVLDSLGSRRHRP